jgi:hypothetical protein
MNSKKIFFLLVVFAALAVIVSAASAAQPDEAAPSIQFDAQVEENIELDSMVVGEDRSVTFRGNTDGLSEACLPVNVFIDGERESWWPVYGCVNPSASGEWIVRVPFDGEGQPVSIHIRVGK